MTSRTSAPLAARQDPVAARKPRTSATRAFTFTPAAIFGGRVRPAPPPARGPSQQLRCALIAFNARSYQAARRLCSSGSHPDRHGRTRGRPGREPSVESAAVGRRRANASCSRSDVRLRLRQRRYAPLSGRFPRLAAIRAAGKQTCASPALRTAHTARRSEPSSQTSATAPVPLRPPLGANGFARAPGSRARLDLDRGRKRSEATHMLASVMPGLRELRAPLAAGYLWISVRLATAWRRPAREARGSKAA